MKKLWVVTITRSGYVLAETEKEAIAEQRRIERWEESKVMAYVPRRTNPLGWDDTAYVYGTDDDKEVTFAQALEMQK